MAATFLTAQWHSLAMLNYRVDPERLLPFVPVGTTLDRWSGIAFVSLVGFLFRDTRVLGLPVPAHRNFEEVNLRLYVRREDAAETRRGVTFIRELVPRAAIAIVARAVYNEPYRALRMRHEVRASPPAVASSYEWRGAFGWAGIHLEAHGEPQSLRAGSEEEFITQHFWGYTRQRDGSTVEYQVQHPSWNVWHAREASVRGRVDDVYPATVVEVLQRPPDSAFLADGSAVTVHRPTRLRD